MNPLTLVILWVCWPAGPAQCACAQVPPPTPAVQKVQATEGMDESEMVDVFDLLRKLRHKDQAEAKQAANDRAAMVAFAPVIGTKPSSGFLAGAAGNVAFYRGDRQTTHISSVVASATFSVKKQTSLSARFTVFGRDDRFRIEGDNRFQWTSQDTYGLGTATTSADRVNLGYDFFRVYDDWYFRLRPNLFAGPGLHFSDHTGVGPGSGTTDEAFSQSAYARYSEAHGFDLDRQVSAGVSLGALWDTRDNPINADRGFLASGSARAFFKGLLGGDSNWQEVFFDLRTYVKLRKEGQRKLAFWFFGDLVVGGVAPYMDLPATGMDAYGRSGRGYGEGRFRGERLLYGEIEYRSTLMRNGLLGMVAFLNLTTVTNLESGERLFHSVAPGAGVGVRVLLSKRSRTNLCFDLGFGKSGSHGLYLAVQEAF